MLLCFEIFSVYMYKLSSVKQKAMKFSMLAVLIFLFLKKEMYSAFTILVDSNLKDCIEIWEEQGTGQFKRVVKKEMEYHCKKQNQY